MAFLRPSFIDKMSWEMAEVYGAITDQILINLAKYFPYWKSSNVPKSAFEYQATMLAQMGQVNRETIKIIRQGLKGADKTLQDVLEQAIMEAVSKSEPQLLQAVKKGILKPAQIPVISPNQTRAFNLYYQQAAQKLNLVNTVMLESTKQAYQATVADIANRVQVTQTALDIGAGETITGVSSWNQAVKHSIDRMKANGITGFIDHGNHHWSAEAYTAMDIRTTVANTARAAVWETNQDFGNDLYLVSYHNGARPLCYPWQNKIISSTDNARVVKDLDGNEIEVIRQSDTSYGEPAGLFGINCKHYPTPFIPGVSVIDGQPQSPEENEKTYNEMQKQRALERKIREEKRDLLMMKAQGATDEEIKAQRAKIRQTDDEIDAFCDETGLHRRQNRESVYTQRSFPDPDTYDVSEFERTQKDEIDKYFTSGGSQQDYTFGQMTQTTAYEKEPERQAPEGEFSFMPSSKNKINTQYIDSSEYAERFNGITGNAEVDKSIAQVSKEILTHRSGSNLEDLALIDMDTGNVIHRVSNSKEIRSISYNAETNDVIEKANKEGKRILAVHNHPNNYPPSMDDGASANIHGYEKGIVVCHDGSIYEYTPTDSDYSISDCKAIHDAIAEAVWANSELKNTWFTSLQEFGMIITERK